jgi:hypothetical protein
MLTGYLAINYNRQTERAISAQAEIADGSRPIELLNLNDRINRGDGALLQGHQRRAASSLGFD